MPSRVSPLFRQQDRCGESRFGRYHFGRYRGCLSARLWRPLPGAAGALVLAFSLGGCSFSYQLDNLFGKKDDGSLTGALRPAAAATLKPVNDLPPEADLDIARAAVSEVMSKNSKDASVSWENPQTGTRGTVTPIATARNEDGMTCHEFLASFERQGTSSWMQGEACRANKGKWEVRSMKPWRT